MIPFWAWYCVRARSLWFFTASNPTLTFGGFEGETKREMYRQLPQASYPKSLFISPSLSCSNVKQKIEAGGLTFPIGAKPDVGQMGLMFRKLESWKELEAYHNCMSADYILQEFIDLPIEVSVFYYRFPGQLQGTITGFVRKDCLSLTGDGRSTLWELILKYKRVQFRLAEMKLRHAENLNKIIPAGETYVLSHALNLSRGGKLVSLEREKDARLLALFDDLSHHNENFYFGRYDIRCKSIEDLKERRNFSILEFNGAGAEPHHVYGNGYSFLEAIRILLFHWKVLFQISMENHKRGVPFWTFQQGLEHLKKSKVHFTKLFELESRTSTAEKSTPVFAQRPATTPAYHSQTITRA